MLAVALYKNPGLQAHKEELKRKELVLGHCIFARFGSGFSDYVWTELGFGFLYFAGDLGELGICLCR